MRWATFLTLPIVLATLGSFVASIAQPSNLPVGVRAVEWLRGHHYVGLINAVERTWYQHHQPPKGGRPKVPVMAGGPVQPDAPQGPPNVTSPATPPFAGEGVWQPASPGAGPPRMYVTYLRPDAVHTSLTAGLVWMDHRLDFQLIPGRQEPGHGPWPEGGRIPADAVGRALAAFNSGFRLEDSHGGVFVDGRTVGHLADGAASFVVDNHGNATVGQWGRDVSLTPTVSAVRQNLTLIVDNGKPVPDLSVGGSRRWGVTLGNAVLVWRSGIGVDASGNLIYAAGPGLSINSLAELLSRAGSVRAMQLDINHTWVSYNLYPQDATRSPRKLLSGMELPANRYLHPDDRDFVAVYRRP
jgi:hypothetical protein